MEKSEFSMRLTKLRQSKGISARDMSLSLGQSPGYINNIENGINYPSMSLFFYICDYLNITPQEFFDAGSANPVLQQDLLDAVQRLNDDQIALLITIANELR